MSNSDQKDDTSEMSEILQAELAGEFGDDATKANRVMPVAGAEPSLDSRERLPRKVAGGFRGLSDDLHDRARDWRNVFRLLEQQRPLLEMAEAERDRLLTELGRVIPEVQETSRQLASSIAAARDGDLSGDLAQRFSRSLSALDDLEGVAEGLGANLLAIRSAWEQYARTAIRAHKMREEIKSL